MKSTYISRDGNITLNNTIEFSGTLLELRNIIDNTIEEYD